jgi:hypothetical protein
MNECTKYLVIGVSKRYGDDLRKGVQAYPGGFLMIQMLYSIVVEAL